MSEIKDPILGFLETVTYDEVMAYTYLLNMEARATLHNDEMAARIQENTELLAGAHYGWDDIRKQLLAVLCNWHLTNVPTRDWRINYFLSLGRGIPEATLVEQFGDLKGQGDSYKRMLISAHEYSNRTIALRIATDAITALYPLVYLEDDDLPIPEHPTGAVISAWADTENWALQQIQHVVRTHLSQCYLYCLTSDVSEKCVKGASGRPSIAAGIMFAANRSAQIVGENGILRLNENKPHRLSLIH